MQRYPVFPAARLVIGNCFAAQIQFCCFFCLWLIEVAIIDWIETEIDWQLAKLQAFNLIAPAAATWGCTQIKPTRGSCCTLEEFTKRCNSKRLQKLLVLCVMTNFVAAKVKSCVRASGSHKRLTTSTDQHQDQAQDQNEDDNVSGLSALHM